jgi:hypothetical protein
MSIKIPLGKNPGSPEERAALVAERIRIEESLSQRGATYLQKQVAEFLVGEKGYGADEIEINPEFTVDLAGNTFTVKGDVIVTLQGRRVFLIRCAMSSPESWERHAVAFCRVVEDAQIPYAAVTDGILLKIIDTVTDDVIAEGPDVFPSRQEALGMMERSSPRTFPKEKLDREKRILYAFDAIRCPAGPEAQS